MTMITFPSTPAPAGTRWTLIQPAQNNINTWTGGRQVIASARGWWECTYTLPPIVGTSNFNPWRSFIAAMRGSVNDAQIPVDPTEQVGASGTAQIAGAGQYGRSLITDGWTPSTTILVAGQFVTIEDQLLQLTSDITSDGGGNATISFEPSIRVSPPDNASIEYRNPYCLMYINDTPSYSVAPGYVYSLSLELKESF